MATTETYVPRLKQRYDEEIRAALKDELELDSIMRVPQVTKITLNMASRSRRRRRSRPPAGP